MTAYILAPWLGMSGEAILAAWTGMGGGSEITAAGICLRIILRLKAVGERQHRAEHEKQVPLRFMAGILLRIVVVENRRLHQLRSTIVMIPDNLDSHP